jgi:hypothetical protein
MKALLDRFPSDAAAMKGMLAKVDSGVPMIVDGLGWHFSSLLLQIYTFLVRPLYNASFFLLFFFFVGFDSGSNSERSSETNL